MMYTSAACLYSYLTTMRAVLSKRTTGSARFIRTGKLPRAIGKTKYVLLHSKQDDVVIVDTVHIRKSLIMSGCSSKIFTINELVRGHPRGQKHPPVVWFDISIKPCPTYVNQAFPGYKGLVIFLGD